MENRRWCSLPLLWKAMLSPELREVHGTANDRIGVFMKQAGETLGGSTIVGEGDNVPFITKQGNGNFLSDGKLIEYPSDESAVDFIAYYPFQPILDNLYYIR